MEGSREEGTRTGVMHVKARLTATERELDRVTKERDQALADAAKLSKFIKDRVGTNVWAHADVMLLVRMLHTGVRDRLRRAAMKAAETGTPASHILYRRLIDRTYQQAADEVARDFPQHAQRVDMIRKEMMTALEATIIEKDQP